MNLVNVIKRFIVFGLTAIALLSGCTATHDLSKLNRDPRCLFVSDVVWVNRRNNSEEFYVSTFSFDDREFIEVYNRLGQSLGYRDIYGTELTNADLEAIGPYVSEVNRLSLHTAVWPIKRNQYIQNPGLFPNARTPYRALPRPAFCNQSAQ